MRYWRMGSAGVLISVVGIVPYFPLAGGLLTGKYRGGQALSNTRPAYIEPLLTERNLQRAERLAAFAEDRGHTLGDLAITWLLAEPQVYSVIAGATNADQVTQNAGAADWLLPADDLHAVRGILEAQVA